MGKPDAGNAASSLLHAGKATGGTETSHYPEEEKATAIPPVAASEKGSAQTVDVSSLPALRPRGRGTLLSVRQRARGVSKQWPT
jgi:hypothetical protein